MAPQDATASLGSSLAALRGFLHIKQRALALKAGISNAQLSRYENGTQVPNASTLHRILMAANVTPQDFYRLDGLLREIAERRESGPVPAPTRPSLRSLMAGESPEDTDPDAVAREAGRMLERVLRLHFKEIRARK
jgi:transcriptional regulator with XRE-family HTH domain